MNPDDIVDTIRETAEAYFDLLNDLNHTDTDDLAESIAGALRRIGALVINEEGR